MALSGPSSAVLLVLRDDQLLASAVVGHDGHRGTVYYVSVDPEFRGTGCGTLVMQHAEQWLRDRGMPKLNLIVRGENKQAIGFYESLGYAVEPNIQMGKRLR